MDLKIRRLFYDPLCPLHLYKRRNMGYIYIAFMVIATKTYFNPLELHFVWDIQTCIFLLDRLLKYKCINCLCLLL